MVTIDKLNAVYGPDATWGKHGKDLIPSLIFSQIYKMEGPYCNDDESCLIPFWYTIIDPITGNKEKVQSSIVCEPVLEELKDENGETVKDEEGNPIMVAPGYRKYLGNPAEDGGIYKPHVDVDVTLTPNEKLAKLFPTALVKIGDKEYDLNYFKDRKIRFTMNKNHRISIWWTKNNIETFRLITKL